MRRWLVVVGLAAVASSIAAGVWTTKVDGFDAAFDWLTVDAIWGEGSPHDELHHLFRNHGYPAPELHAHPRPPGALLVQIPLLLGDLGHARPAMAVVSIVALLVVVYVTGRLTNLRNWQVALIGVVAALSPFMSQTLVWGAQSAALAAVIGVAWLFAVEGRDKPAGVLLGIAAAVKLFPALIVVMLWQRRPVVAYWGAGVAAGFTLVGLLLPDVSIAGTLEAIRSAQESNNGNPLNLGAPLWLSVAGVVILMVASRWLSVTGVFVAGSLGMVAFSPTAWSHYLVMWVLPVVVAVARRGSLSDPVPEIEVVLTPVNGETVSSDWPAC